MSHCGVATVDLRCFLSSVAEIKSAYNLRENFPNKFFAYKVVTLKALANNFLEVSALTILHDYENLHISFINDAVVVANNVWVPQLSQNVHFRNNLLLFFLVHFSIVEFFPHK